MGKRNVWNDIPSIRLVISNMITAYSCIEFTVSIGPIQHFQSIRLWVWNLILRIILEILKYRAGMGLDTSPKANCIGQKPVKARAQFSLKLNKARYSKFLNNWIVNPKLKSLIFLSSRLIRDQNPTRLEKVRSVSALLKCLTFFFSEDLHEKTDWTRRVHCFREFFATFCTV